MFLTIAYDKIPLIKKESVMSERLKELLEQEAKEVDGQKKLTCSQAFKIAAELNIRPKQVGDACNEFNIKLHACQLGCF